MDGRRLVAPLTGSFTFDGRSVPIESGDTFGSALHRAGEKVLSRSLKYHRPRGLYCCAGSCASCFVAVDGIPNVPACMRAAQDGATVESQNRIGSAKHDLLGVVDKVYRRGFDPHAAFTRPRVLNQAFMVAVRFMSGLGKAPKVAGAAPPRRHVKNVDHLIVGAGLHGLRSARDAAGSGGVLVVDELPALGGSALWDPSETETRALASDAATWRGVETWTDALAFGVYDDVVAVKRGDDLWEVRADRITIAPGVHDAWPLFGNNDLPGVLSLRGASRLLHEHNVLPGRRVVGHGRSLPGGFAAGLRAAGGDLVTQGQVSEVRGGAGVERANVDGAWVDCDAVVCNLGGTPRIELFQQAGCDLHFRDGVLSPRRDGAGRTSRSDIVALFSEAAA